MIRVVKLEFDRGALRPIGPSQMAQARELARSSPRLRGLVRYHDHAEPIQRMLSAVDPRSYVRPHKHQAPDKTEVFIALAGSAVACTFDEDGRLRDSVRFGGAEPLRGVEIPAGVWHSLVSLDEGTVLYELIDGPFDAATHKRFAPWAPEEGSSEGAAYLRALRAQLGLPPLA
jgi:cupin fold WbuC family metalloprotein